MPVPTGLVHGMGKELVEPDWSPLTSTEVRAVLARYPQPGARPGPLADDEMITWRSPRPMSAAALVRRGGVDLFVKRHHVRVRTPAQLAVEHAFIGHLRAHGIAAPAVQTTTGVAPTVTVQTSDSRIDEIRAHLKRYHDFAAQGKYADAGKELEAIEAAVKK